MEETTLFPLRVEQRGFFYEDRNHKVNRVVAHFDGFRKEFLVSDFGEPDPLGVV